MILGQSALIFDIQEQFREDGKGVYASDGEDQGEPTIVAKGVKGRPNSTEADGNGRRWLTPFRLSSSGSIEQLLDLHSESSRPSVVAEQGWGDVFQTCSTVKSVPSLLRGCEADCVTFIIPRADQRPWSARIGFYCVYESLFEKDSKLWFPIPRLITSYCSRRDIALTKLMIGTARIAVALMVMAAEADVSMSVRFFEELTQTQPKLNGIYAVQMRSGLHILSGHPSRTKYWQRSYFYVRADKIAFEEPPGDNSQFLWSHRIER